MFVPRAVRLNGVREPQRPDKTDAVAKDPTGNVTTTAEDTHDENLPEEKIKPQNDSTEASPKSGEKRFTTAPVTPVYLAQVAIGVELIFSDYAHHDEVRSKWLSDHYRTVDGDEKCIHSILMPLTCCC
jgi:hypothetical protein